VANRRVALADSPEGLRLPIVRAYAGGMMPYFLSGLHSLVPRMVKGLGTFGITENSFLLLDPDVLKKLFMEEASTVFLHEYLHKYFNHAERFREMVRKGLLDPEDHSLFNDAGDAEINDNLEEANCVFPRPEIFGGPHVTPQSLGLPKHRLAEEYAIALKKRGHKPNRPPKADQGGLPACGSASGNPLDGEPPGNDPDARDTTDTQMQRKSDADQVASHEKTQGSVPSGIKRMAEGLLPSSKIPWDKELQHEVSRGIQHKQGQADYTYSERSRMQASFDMMYGEEAPVLPGMYAPLATVALVVDTSGSMTDSLRKVAGEAQGILRSMGGARVLMIACDAKVHTMTMISDVSQLKAGLKGGGGTDFRPAFDALLKLPPAKRPDIVVFATDGYGSYPSSAPPWKHIWLEVDGKIAVDWGRTIHADSEDES
jgi:predicted metal-dependent peptidase